MGIEWQADSVLPTAAMNWIGAVRTYANRSQFYFGFFKTLALAVLSFEEVNGFVLTSFIVDIPDIPLGAWFWPTMLHWVAVVMLGGVTFVVLDRALLHPAQITYNSHQQSKENRNPTFREVMKVSQQLDRIEEKHPAFSTDGGEADDVR